MIGWRDGADGLHRGSLFAAFAALARGEAWSFPALRPHQREPWHAFTVQVAALALIRAGADTVPETEEAWEGLLRGLTPDHPTAWELVVEDWSQPALLQPPVVADGDRAQYKNRLPTPDALDMLVTAKNHDVKAERMAAAADQDWLFALVTLQTYEGFLGAGNYGISRMNGGFATRMTFGVRPSGGAADAFRRDVARLAADARARPDRRTGLALLWTEPWDGSRALDFTALDELYVEVCRRIRLERAPGGLAARAAGSKVARVAAAEFKGRTGDPWAPVKADATTSHTPTGAGFGYRQMAQLLDRDRIAPPLLARLDAADAAEGLTIVAAALVRGQGKTEGLHRRAVRTSRVEEIAESGDDRVLDVIGDTATRRAGEAGEAGKRLRRALIMLVQGGPEQARLDDDAAGAKVDPWVRRFDARVDRIFFDAPFWDQAVAPEDQRRDHALSWRRQLCAMAELVFTDAAEAAPRTAMRRIRAIARARAMLDGQMNKWIGEIA
jgi:CRISPR system Cascade subunit CasA